MFKDKLKKLREQSNLTLEELSKKTRIPSKDISSWENGESFPDMDYVEQLAKGLEADKEELLDKDNYLDIVKETDKIPLRRPRVTVSIIAVLIAILTGGLYINNFNSTEYDFHKGSYFMPFMLEKFGVKNLKECDKAYDSIYFTSDDFYHYYAKIESKEDFKAYAGYVLDYLSSDSSIDNLSFRTTIKPKNDDNNYCWTRNNYLVTSSRDLEDYIYKESSSSLGYAFFYTVDLPEDRYRGGEINCQEISLSYSLDENYYISDEPNIETSNFEMRIFDRIDEPYNNYYFADEYFFMEKEEITNENIYDYFDFTLNDYRNEYNLVISPKTMYANINLNFKIDYLLTMNDGDEVVIEIFTDQILAERTMYHGSMDNLVNLDQFETYDKENFVSLEISNIDVSPLSSLYTYTALNFEPII